MLSPLVPVVRNSKAIKIDNWQELPESELSELVKKNNGGNVGVRLDHYAVIDPDEPAAETFCNQWERKGILVPTTSWKTARGFTKRLYLRPDNWPFSSHTASISGMKLQLRSGSGVQDVIPPSTINGNRYIWIPGRSPDELAPVPIPQEVLQHFINYSTSSFNLLSFKNNTSTSKYSKHHAKTVNFEEGMRDESLFHVAHTLFKGGMCEEDVTEIIIRLASSCNPPFPFKDAEKKVESAKKRAANKEINVAEVIKNFILGQEEDIKRTFWVKECGLWDNLGQREAAYKAITRLKDEGFITVTGKRGWYRKVKGDVDRIDYMAVDPESYLRIKWPFRFENLFKTFPKSISVIAGATNAGKSSFLMEFCRLNMYDKRLPKIRYISSETDAYELREKYEYYHKDETELHVPLEDWADKLDIVYRTEDFIDVINPNWINIIDHYKAEGEFYEIGKELQEIHKKLKKGIAIIALQKNPNTQVGYGGHQTEHLARFVLNIDPGRLTIKKAKNIMAGINKGADGTKIGFKLAKGYIWKPKDISELFWYWNYKDEEAETLSF